MCAVLRASIFQKRRIHNTVYEAYKRGMFINRTNYISFKVYKPCNATLAACSDMSIRNRTMYVVITLRMCTE